MDIDLGDGCGIELAKEVKKTDSGTCVIFVTAHPEYVEESFEVEPVYFLVKPIRPDSFHRAMDRAMERLAAERQESRLTVTFQNRVSAVAFAGHFLHRIQRPQRHHPRRHPGFANLREALQPPAAGGQPFYSVSQKLSRQHGLRHWLPGQHPGACAAVWKFL